jgi:hypothetical protein
MCVQNVFLYTDIHFMSLDLRMTVLRKIYIYIQYLQYFFTLNSLLLLEQEDNL